MNQQISTLCLLVVCATSFAAGTSPAATLTEYSGGHADIGLAFEGGELELHYHFGSTAVLNPGSTEDEFDPSEAYVRVPDLAEEIVIPQSQMFFNSALGLDDGDSVWILPQTSNPALPFVGIAAEELDPNVFTSATLSMSDFTGPGAFALWQNGTAGPNTPVLQTNDGVDSNDEFALVVGNHGHYNFGFTQEGVYDVEFTATATGAVPGTVTDVETFRFVVGSTTAVPEPGSLVALASLGIAGFVVRRRRAKAAAKLA